MWNLRNIYDILTVWFGTICLLFLFSFFILFNYYFDIFFYFYFKDFGGIKNILLPMSKYEQFKENAEFSEFLPSFKETKEKVSKQTMFTLNENWCKTEPGSEKYNLFEPYSFINKMQNPLNNCLGFRTFWDYHQKQVAQQLLQLRSFNFAFYWEWVSCNTKHEGLFYIKHSEINCNM